MSRHPVERYNEDFIKLFDRYLATKEVCRGWKAAAEQEVADMLGVKRETVHSWRRPEGSKTAFACPKWRVDMYKLALPPEISRVSDGTREAILESLKMLRGAGIMAPVTAKAFERIARKRKRENV